MTAADRSPAVASHPCRFIASWNARLLPPPNRVTRIPTRGATRDSSDCPIQPSTVPCSSSPNTKGRHNHIVVGGHSKGPVHDIHFDLRAARQASTAAPIDGSHAPLRPQVSPSAAALGAPISRPGRPAANCTRRPSPRYREDIHTTDGCGRIRSRGAHHRAGPEPASDTPSAAMSRPLQKYGWTAPKVWVDCPHVAVCLAGALLSGDGIRRS
jgi:hypothetical protein